MKSIYMITLSAILAGFIVAKSIHQEVRGSRMAHKASKMLEAELVALRAEEPPEAGLALLITKAADKHGLERVILSCLLKVESNYNVAVISTTSDYGIGQINIHTAKSFGMDLSRLISDTSYSIDRSAYVLSYYKQLMAADYPANWIMFYNVGPGPLSKRNRATNGINYMQKINKCRTSMDKVWL